MLAGLVAWRETAEFDNVPSLLFLPSLPLPQSPLEVGPFKTS